MVHEYFNTERLLVTELIWEDRLTFHQLQSDPKVFTYLEKTPQDILEENEKELLFIINTYKQPQNQRLIMAVRENKDQKFLGTCALYVNNEGNMELGYRLLPEYWGEGIASELIKGLITFGFKKFETDFLCAYVFDDHMASIRVLEVGGMELKRVFYNEAHQKLDRYYVIMKRK
jgi:[ribosomal protein S5]-alanine N-acetyltransferase